MDLKERAKQLKTDIPALFLALKRADTPFTAKILASMAVGYALAPIDLVPDFIPMIGFLDDLIILPFLVMLTINRIPPNIMNECRRQAEGLWVDGKPKKWYYAIPIISIWIIVLFLVIKCIVD